MIPQGCEINLHHMQANTDQHQGRAGTGPAQRVMQRLALTDSVENDIVATQEYLIAGEATVELRTCSTLYANIAILGIDDMGCAEACGLFHLEWVTSQDADLALWCERAQDL